MKCDFSSMKIVKISMKSRDNSCEIEERNTCTVCYTDVFRLKKIQ